VTVRTSDVAFVYLQKETFTIASRTQIGNRLQLLDPVAMIEVQYERIGLPTIDAGMYAQVFFDLAIQILTTASPCRARSRTHLVLSVVLARIFPHAEFATLAATPTRAVAEREILDWSCQPATGACAAAGTVVKRHIGSTTRRDRVGAMPSKLRGRSSAVTVRAAHVAFRNFCHNDRPRFANDQKRDLQTLG